MLYTWVTHDALFALLGDGVVVNRLVRAGLNAQAIAVAAILVEYNDAVFVAFVNSVMRTSV